MNVGGWHGVPALAGRTSSRLKTAFLAKAVSWKEHCFKPHAGPVDGFPANGEFDTWFTVVSSLSPELVTGVHRQFR
jgi:hypothetical protein